MASLQFQRSVTFANVILCDPLSEYTPRTANNSPAKSENPDLMLTEYGRIYKRDFASTQNATEPDIILEKREKLIMKIKCASEKRHAFAIESVKPAEKTRKDQSTEYSEPRNGADERESYWKRRRRNNASAQREESARTTNTNHGGFPREREHENAGRAYGCTTRKRVFEKSFKR